MYLTRVLSLSALAAALLGASSKTWAQVVQATGVDLTVDEGFGARQQGMGLTRAGFQDGADAVINAPASMNDVDDFTISTTHLEQFGNAADFDNAAVLIPWNATGTLGLAIARYAVSGIELRPAGDINIVPDGVFTTSDWLIAGSLARRWGGLDIGATVDLLYRDLGDQVGAGLRADGMAEYTFSGQYRVGVFISGLVPATAAWESGTTEYELPDASSFVSGRWDLPYFYGSLEASFETPELFELGARSATGLQGDRAITDPLSLLETSSLGAEFRFNFGLCLRAGLGSGLDPSTASSTLRLGVGYGWRNILGVDYAFTTSQDLGDSYRLSLWWTPVFSRFDGRGFRPKSPRQASSYTPAPQSSESSEPSAPPPSQQPQEQLEGQPQGQSPGQLQGQPQGQTQSQPQGNAPQVQQNQSPKTPQPQMNTLPPPLPPDSSGNEKEILEDN